MEEIRVQAIFVASPRPWLLFATTHEFAAISITNDLKTDW